MKYSISDNEETFYGQFDTEADALDEALSNYDDADVVYVGECHQRTIGQYLQFGDVENLLEKLAENAIEECGDAAEDWLQEPLCPRQVYPRPQDAVERKKCDADYQAKVDVWRKAKRDRVAFLLEGFRVVLETWATEEGCQPRFWHIKNVKSFGRDENSCTGQGECGEVHICE